MVIRLLKRVGAAKGSLSAVANSLASRVGVLGLSLVTGIIMARTLGPAGRGTTSAIALWPLVLSGLLTFGIPVSLKYNIRRRTDDPEQLFSVGLMMSGALGIIALIIGYVFVPRWLSQYPEPVVRFAQLMMGFAPFMTVNLLLQAFLESRGEFAFSGSMLYLPPIGTLISLVVLLKLGLLNVFSVAIAYEAPYSCVTAITLFRLRESIKVPSAIRRRAGLLLSFGWRAYGLDILNTLNAQIGQVIVVGLLSASSFGFYAVALNVSRIVLVAGVSLNTVLFPKASELSDAGAIALVNRSARIFLAVNIVAGIGLVAAMPLLIRLAYGAPYETVVGLARLLTCEVVVSGTVSTLNQAFMATNRPGLVTILQTIGLCTTFPLMIVLIPHYGLAGAAYALLISTTLRLVLVLGSFPLFLKHDAPNLVLTKQDIREVRARVQRAMS